MNTQMASLPTTWSLEFQIRRARAFRRGVRRWLARSSSSLRGALTVSMVRRVAPDRPPLERHEFESIETRRGGFGSW